MNESALLRGKSLSLLLLVAAAFLFVPGVFLRDFWLYNESRRALVALEMLRTGDLAVPRLMGTPLLTKPPMYYWLEWAVYRIAGGPSDWGARLPSLLSGIFGVLAVAHLLRRLFDARAALLGASILATIPVYVSMSQSAEPEVLFAASGAGAMACAAEMLFASAPSRLWKWGFFACLGISFMTKGPIVPGGVLLALLIWCAILRREAAASRFFWWPGLVVLLAPAFAWGGLLFLKGYRLRSFLNEISQHLGEDAPHRAPFRFYFGNVKEFFFPWPYIAAAILFFWLASALSSGGASLRRMPRAAWDYLKSGGGERLLILLSFLAPALILSAIPSKRYYYAAILAPPFAALVAMIAADWAAAPSGRFDRLLSSYPRPIAALAFLLAAGAVVLAMKAHPRPIPEPLSGKGMPDRRQVWLLISLLFFTLAPLILSRLDFRRSLPLLVALCLAVWISRFNFILHPAMNPVFSLREAAKEISARLPAEEVAFTTGTNFPTWFYLGRIAAPPVKDRHQLRKFLLDHPSGYGVVDGSWSDEFKEFSLPFEVLYESRYIAVESERVFLVRVKAPSN